jgi:hypothetical protein
LKGRLWLKKGCFVNDDDDDYDDLKNYLLALLSSMVYACQCSKNRTKTLFAEGMTAKARNYT